MSHRLAVFIPILFVFIYGSGFVGINLGLPFTDPFTFLALRFLLTSSLLLLLALIIKAQWRLDKLKWLVASGFLLQGVFSIGVLYAQYFGMKPAVAALIIALQPLLVAVLGGFYLGERVNMQRWLGLIIGIIGVSFVVADGLSTEGITLASLSWCLVGLLGLTAGQLIQKKHCASMSLVVGGGVQSSSAGIAMALGALLFEPLSVIWSTELMIGLLWMAVGVSIGALSLLYLMLRHSTANQVASVFYGVPVAAALVAWPIFGHIPETIDWLGFAIVALSIIVANTHIRFRYPLWLRDVLKVSKL
ncbi:MAG: DMT family transporter [Cellvibrionaceae bacterium]